MALEADPSHCPHPAAASRPLQGMPGPPPPHLPHVVSDTPVGHHLQGMQGHLLGPRTVLG